MLARWNEALSVQIEASGNLHDALVIGGGPAGLSAALQLARWCRSVVVVSRDQPGRAEWPQVNHNYLGFPDGIRARELLRRGREQVERYGVRFYETELTRLSFDEASRTFRADGSDLRLRARAVLLATGVIDRWVVFPGYEAFIGRSLHWCIVCDGYEMRGKRVIVAGNDEHTATMAIQMQRFTPDVVVVTNSGALGMPRSVEERLDQHGIRLIVDRIVGARSRAGEPGMLATVLLERGEVIEGDHLFSLQGSDPEVALAAALGVRRNADGFIDADIEGKTSVPGVYAAGDVTRLFSHQIAAAVHEGGLAANALNFFLFERDEEAFQMSFRNAVDGAGSG